MDNPEVINAFLAVIVAALTQLGIPAVFVYAWFLERRRNDEIVRQYLRDLRRCGGMVLPEDMLSGPPVGGGGD